MSVATPKRIVLPRDSGLKPESRFVAPPPCPVQVQPVVFLMQACVDLNVLFQKV